MNMVIWASKLTDEQLDSLYDMERKWRETLPDMPTKELVEVYPGSLKAAKKGLKESIKFYKGEQNRLIDFRQYWQENVINHAPHKAQREMTQALNERIERDMAFYEARIKRLEYELISLEPRTETPTLGTITDDDIVRAKMVPISSLIPVKRNMAACLWHDDKHPSLHVYKDHVYCFVCQHRADTIEIYMKINNCDFKTAVKALAP
ncbi:MAG: CHC2 zinc finger domain-containing protein [Candidatus Limnocylindrales bacterium]